MNKLRRLPKRAWAAGVVVKLVIESGAVVAGRGGNGGNAAYATIVGGDYVYHAATNGGNGGNGLFIDYPIFIDNTSGVIGGGGGGGGGGSAGTYLFDEAGGGGGGAALGAGGLRGNVDGTNNWPANDGDNANADNIHGGNGGAAGSTGLNAGNGGNGGDLGQNGQNGGGQSNYGLGGIAGDCIHGNSFITWIATGTRYGAIV